MLLGPASAFLKVAAGRSQVVLLHVCTMATHSATVGDPEHPDGRIRAAKKVLRKEITAKLQSLDDDYVAEQASQIMERLLQLDPVVKGRSLSVYLSMPSKEVSTYPILDSLFRSCPKKEVFVPKVVGPRAEDMKMIPVSSSEEISSFPRSNWGIPEPPHDPSREDGTYCGRLEVVVMPGVAFDSRCNRLGHGKGYYDCFLTRLDKSNMEQGRQRPYTVALALREQVVDSVPMDSFDQALDAVVTPDTVYTSQSGDH